MPTYEYRCLKEGHTFEVFQSIKDDPIQTCEVCKGPVEKLISQSAFHLKGTGWYVTDYKNKAKTGTEADKGSKSLVSEPAQSTSESAVEPVKEATKPIVEAQKKD